MITSMKGSIDQIPRQRTTRLLILALLLVGLGACVWSLFFWQPRPDWNPSPDQIVFRMDTGSEVDVDSNYIPELRIWGDGRRVLVKQSVVMEGRLSQQQLRYLIQSFIDAGWFRRIHWFTDKDYALDELTIVLSETSRTRIINREDMAVFQLIQFLRAGAGGQVQEVVPERGLLYVFPIAGTASEGKITGADYVWPDDTLAFDLDTIARDERNGIEITGSELELAWKIATSGQALVKSKGKLFYIGVEVEGITE